MASRISSSTVAVDGTVVVTATTVGSRKAFAFVFIIPPVAVAFVLFCLIVATRTFKDTSKNTSEGEFLSCSNMGDLIQMGQRQGETERQRETERQQEAETERETEMGQETDRQREMERQRETERQQEAGTERETETETERGTDMGQETESDGDNLLLFAAPHGQSPGEEQDQ